MVHINIEDLGHHGTGGDKDKKEEMNILTGGKEY